MDGALLVDKPAGPTSHDIVAIVRRALQTPRVGHTGTLDPLATGLLVLLVGQATRCAQFLVADEKEYVADVRLGIATPTYDAQGLEARGARTEERGAGTEARAADDPVTTAQVEALLPEFLGTFPQLPPPFSAKKVAGVRAYEKARKNQAVDLKPVDVTVRELEILSDAPGSDAPGAAPRTSQPAPRTSLLRLRIVCSSGFYVRSLAHDIGQRLGCGAHLEALRRTRAGRFHVTDAISLAELIAQGGMTGTRIIPLNTVLADMPAVTLNPEGVRRVTHGHTLASEHVAGPLPDMTGHAHARAVDADGTLLAVAEPRAGGLLHPVLVLG